MTPCALPALFGCRTIIIFLKQCSREIISFFVHRLLSPDWDCRCSPNRSLYGINFGRRNKTQCCVYSGRRSWVERHNTVRHHLVLQDTQYRTSGCQRHDVYASVFFQPTLFANARQYFDGTQSGSTRNYVSQLPPSQSDIEGHGNRQWLTKRESYHAGFCLASGHNVLHSGGNVQR